MNAESLNRAKVGIIGAMEVELSMLKGALTEPKPPVTVSGMEFFEGTLEGVSVVLVKSGVGKVNAALCAQTLILRFGVSHILNTGIAGALGEGLGVLDMVISTDALYHDMDATGFGYRATEIPQMETSDFPADKMLLCAAERAFAESESAKEHRLFKGRVASGDQFISDREKKNLIKKTCSPSCVEMEGAAIAHAAFVNKIPFLIIRCMSDMADDGHESVYNFNEESAAKESASLVRGLLKNLTEKNC